VPPPPDRGFGRALPSSAFSALCCAGIAMGKDCNHALGCWGKVRKLCTMRGGNKHDRTCVKAKRSPSIFAGCHRPTEYTAPAASRAWRCGAICQAWIRCAVLDPFANAAQSGKNPFVSTKKRIKRGSGKALSCTNSTSKCKVAIHSSCTFSYNRFNSTVPGGKPKNENSSRHYRWRRIWSVVVANC